MNPTITASDQGGAGAERALNVILLFAPDNAGGSQFERLVAEWSSLGHAVLVVFPRAVATATLQRLALAGADLCVVAPTPAQLFSHVEQARRLHRRAESY